MSATIKDIARETGLALATISKYINGGTVRPQNKKQIDEAIRKLNYVPRNTARGLRSSKTYRIGLVSGPPNTPHNAFLLSKIENTMRAHGYSLTFMSGDKYKDHVNKFVPHMLRSGIDGLFDGKTGTVLLWNTPKSLLWSWKNTAISTVQTVYRPAVPPEPMRSWSI